MRLIHHLLTSQSGIQLIAYAHDDTIVPGIRLLFFAFPPLLVDTAIPAYIHRGYHMYVG